MIAVFYPFFLLEKFFSGSILFKKVNVKVLLTKIDYYAAKIVVFFSLYYHSKIVILA